MRPVLMRQVAADHISEMHAKAQDERLARQAHRARRRAPSARLRLPASGTLSYDDPRLDPGQHPARREQSSAPLVPVLAGSPPRDAKRWTITADRGKAAGGLIRGSGSAPAPGRRPRCGWPRRAWPRRGRRAAAAVRAWTPNR
jgi:hypothetical protein